jgi:hypothetical protein
MFNMLFSFLIAQAHDEAEDPALKFALSTAQLALNTHTIARNIVALRHNWATHQQDLAALTHSFEHKHEEETIEEQVA